MLNTRVRTAGREAASAKAQQLIPPCERLKLKHLSCFDLFNWRSKHRAVAALAFPPTERLSLPLI